MSREIPSKKHQSVNWKWCCLSQAEKKPFPISGHPISQSVYLGPHSTTGYSHSAGKRENHELENGSDAAIRLCVLFQNSFCSQPCRHKLVCSSKLSKVTINDCLQKMPLFSVSILCLSLFIFNFSGSHTAKGCYFGCLACFLLVQWIKVCPRHCVVHSFVIFLAGYSPHCKVILYSLNHWAEGVFGHHCSSKQQLGLQLWKNEPLSESLNPLLTPNGSSFLSAKYRPGHYPRWCNFVPFFTCCQRSK